MSNLLAMPLTEISFEVHNNEDWIDSIVYCVPPPQDITAPQLDLRGISFYMDVRRSATDHEVILEASTDDATIAIGLPPNYGFLIVNVPLAKMKYVAPGAYVGDILGTDGVNERVVISLNLTVDEGVTR
jgi:hypothetical protein